MKEIQVKIEKDYGLTPFLELSGFEVQDLGNGVLRTVREQELPVFLKIDEEVIYFEADLGNISQFASKDFYFKLLKLNTEILPVSVGINNSSPEDPRLVLIESREVGSLNDHEILCVFDAIELAVDKIEPLLSEELKTVN